MLDKNLKMTLFEGTEEVYDIYKSVYRNTYFYVAKQKNGIYALYEKDEFRSSYYLLALGKKNIKNWLLENSEFITCI